MDDKTVTIVQIAKESGVSIATVSRYLNKTSKVSPEKGAVIQKVIDKYNYSPNALARSLISRQTMTLGVMMPTITNPYFSSMLSQIEQEARANGYTILFCSSMYSSTEDSGAESDYILELSERKVDGLIIIGGEIDLENRSEEYSNVLTQVSQNIPVVVVGKKIENIPCTFVERDEGAGIRAAIKHLYSLGHRRIAFLGGEPGVSITADRVQAYQQALADCGLAYDSRLISLSDYYVNDGFWAVNHLLSEDIDFTAALAINDNVAIGVYRALADWRLSVPKDISIIRQYVMAPHL